MFHDLLALFSSPPLDRTPLSLQLVMNSVDEQVSSETLKRRLIELENIEAELARRKKEKGLWYFTPNPPQLTALRSNARIVAYCGGNRAGKSHAGAAWLSAHLTHYYPKCDCHGEWFGKNRYKKSLKAVIVVTEFQKIESVIEPKIFSLLPKDIIKQIKRTPQGYLRRILCKDGSLVDVLSGEQDPMAFEGQDWDVAWIDEPMERRRFISIQRGLMDRSGLMLLTFTPIIEPWMKRDIIDKADGKSISVIEADTYQNLQSIHGEAIQSREAISFLENLMSEDERQSRIHGKFFHLRGLVYPMFNQAVHIREFKYTYPDPVIAVLDPADRKDHHMIWSFLDKFDNLYVDSELKMPGTIEQLSRAILQHEARMGYKMKKRMIDPNFCQKPLLTSGKTVLEELQAKPYPVQFSKANNDAIAGRLKVKDYLSYRTDLPLGITNCPKLYFARGRTHYTTESIKEYQYDEWVGPTVERRDRKEEVMKRNDDGADCVRYLVMDNPKFENVSRSLKEYELETAPY